MESAIKRPIDEILRQMEAKNPKNDDVISVNQDLDPSILLLRNQIAKNESERHDQYILSIHELIPKIVAKIKAKPPAGYQYWLSVNGEKWAVFLLFHHKGKTGPESCWIATEGEIITTHLGADKYDNDFSERAIILSDYHECSNFFLSRLCDYLTVFHDELNYNPLKHYNLW